ncbi:hypothetical protein ACP4OV_009052 [Aristida adscensionis]
MTRRFVPAFVLLMLPLIGCIATASARDVVMFLGARTTATMASRQDAPPRHSTSTAAHGDATDHPSPSPVTSPPHPAASTAAPHPLSPLDDGPDYLNSSRPSCDVIWVVVVLVYTVQDVPAVNHHVLDEGLKKA